MFANLEHFFEISYELTRFFFFCIAVGYALRTRIYPWMYASYLDIKKSLSDLEEKKELLDQTTAAFEMKKVQQEKLITSLDQKLEQWHAACLKDLRDYQGRYRDAMEKMNSKRKLQSKRLREEKMLQEVFPQSIKEAEDYFEQHYVGKEGEKLLSNLIDHLTHTL